MGEIITIDIEKYPLNFREMIVKLENKTISAYKEKELAMANYAGLRAQLDALLAYATTFPN